VNVTARVAHRRLAQANSAGCRGRPTDDPHGRSGRRHNAWGTSRSPVGASNAPLGRLGRYHTLSPASVVSLPAFPDRGPRAPWGLRSTAELRGATHTGPL
jgi:hypothetical protein